MNPTEFVAGLRAMADFIESAPLELPLPNYLAAELTVYSGKVGGPDGETYSLDSKMGMALIAAMIGSADKDADDQMFRLVKQFAPNVSITWTAWRKDVCEPRIVGKRVIPAVEAQLVPAKLIEAQPEREVDVVEWDCPSLMAVVRRPRTGSVEIAPELALPAPSCQHSPGEDCMTCASCGRCSEELNLQDYCPPCAV